MMNLLKNKKFLDTLLADFDNGTFIRLIIGFIFLFLLPFVLEVPILGFRISEWFSIKILIITLIFAYTAQAWNIMSGYTGQFSFGHAAFFGIGAYTTQKLLADISLNPWIGMIIGGVLAALYGMLIGFLCFRYNLRGHYFALSTLAFAELLRHTIKNLPQLNAAYGYYRPFPEQYASGPGILAFQFENDLLYYYLILAFLFVITLISWLIRQSKLGLYFFAIRDDELVAETLGVNSFRYKIIAVAISAFFTAWAGTFWSMYFNTITPDIAFGLFKNVDILLPAVVGGLGTLFGPIIGSFIVTPISEIVRTSFTGLYGVDRIIYGVILILIVLYSPEGAVTWLQKLRKFKLRVIDK